MKPVFDYEETKAIAVSAEMNAAIDRYVHILDLPAPAQHMISQGELASLHLRGGEVVAVNLEGEEFDLSDMPQTMYVVVMPYSQRYIVDVCKGISDLLTRCDELAEEGTLFTAYEVFDDQVYNFH